MGWSPRAVRVGVVVALGLPAFIVLMTSSLQAQFPKGGPKMPGPGQMPQLVWTCNKCGKQIGTGAAPPGTCPFCGVKIINGINAPGPINQNPMPPINPQPNPGQQNLAGTTWSGNESLAGFGALTFQFQPGGQATMIDVQQNTPGRWNLVGNSITIDFGGAVYNGAVIGNQMNGTARNGKDVWTWNVSKQGNNLPPNNPAPPPNNPMPVVNVPPPNDNFVRPAEPIVVEKSGPSRAGIIIGVLAGFLCLGVVFTAAGVGIYFALREPKKPARRSRR